MKPLSFARRPARWLMAAGLALAAMQAAPAAAQPLPDLVPDLNLDGRDPQPTSRARRGRAFLHQEGQRSSTATTSSTTLASAPAAIRRSSSIPASSPTCKAVRLDFRDTLPAGLEIVDVQVSGDGTDAVGGPLPAAAISTTTNPNDTAKIADFRLSTTDLDGVGRAQRAAMSTSVITAKIDHAAFPARRRSSPTRASSTITAAGGAVGRGAFARPDPAGRWRSSGPASRPRS